MTSTPPISSSSASWRCPACGLRETVDTKGDQAVVIAKDHAAMHATICRGGTR